MAYAFLKGLGCDGAIGTITVDLAANQAKGTPGQKIVSCQNGVVGVDSSRYPFCFQGAPDRPEPTTASILKFLPFNNDLNRYLLVVNGLKASHAKVTWGDQTKEFSNADLAKGINLAAEFLQNPFVGQFTKIETAIRAKQNQETILVQLNPPLLTRSSRRPSPKIVFPPRRSPPRSRLFITPLLSSRFPSVLYGQS